MVLVYSYKNVNDEHEKMVLLVMRNVWASKKLDLEKAKEIFPDNYLQEKKNAER